MKIKKGKAEKRPQRHMKITRVADGSERVEIDYVLMPLIIISSFKSRSLALLTLRALLSLSNSRQRITTIIRKFVDLEK